MLRRLSGYMIVFAITWLAGCVSPGPAPQPSPLNSPVTVGVNSSPILPTKAPSASKVVRFQIDRPLKAGATIVTGSGPAGVPISIAGVTTMGNELGAGVIGSNNRFSIAVPSLSANVRVGIALGDLIGTNFSSEDFNTDVYKGDEALLVPLVGYYLDSILVQP